MLGDLLVRLDQRLLPPVARVLHRLFGGEWGARLFTVSGLTLSVTAMLAGLWMVNRDPPPAGAAGPLVRIGPVQGQDIADYTRRSRARLARLLSERTTARRGEVYALVSFSAYLAPDRLTPIVGGVNVVQAYLRVPVPRARTGSFRIATYQIPLDITEGMAQLAEVKERQAARWQELMSDTPDDTVPDRQLRESYRSQALTVAAEATALRQECSCVYAVVVRANPTELDEVAARAEVRVVDPATQVRRLDRAVFQPPLPEQLVGASVPQDEPFDPTAAAAQAIPSTSVTTTPSRGTVARSTPGRPGPTLRTIPVRPAPSCARTSGRASGGQ